MQTELNALVLRHATDEPYHRSLRNAAAEYARGHCDFAAVSARYLLVLDELHSLWSAPGRPLLHSA
jgi:hypothetical protein